MAGSPTARGSEVCTQVAHHAGGDPLQAGVAEARDDVDVERGGVALLRMPREVRGGVPGPPQFREFRERFTMVRDDGRATETLGSLEAGVQRRGVGFAADDARAGASLFIAPAHTPDRAGELSHLDRTRRSGPGPGPGPGFGR